MATRCENAKDGAVGILFQEIDKEFQSEIVTFFVSMQVNHSHFVVSKLENASFDEVAEVSSYITSSDITAVDFKKVVDGYFATSTTVVRDRIVQGISTILSKKASGVPDFSSVNRSYLVQILVALKYRMPFLADSNPNIVYVGAPDSVELMTLTMMTAFGFFITIVNGTNHPITPNATLKEVKGTGGKPIDPLLFLEQYKSLTRPVLFQINPGLYGGEPVSKLIDLFKRTDGVFRVEIIGVDLESTYAETATRIVEYKETVSAPLLVMKTALENPTFEEVESIKNVLGSFHTEPELNLVVTILKKSLAASAPQYASAIVAEVHKILAEKEFPSESKQKNYSTILYCWLMRFSDMFIKQQEKSLVYVWNSVGSRENDLIRLFTILPIDILHFAPTTASALGELNFYRVKLGEDNNAIVEMPKVDPVQKVHTTAFKAERELDTLLYTDTGAFREMQFKEIAPVVLSTTFDEIGILWDQPAKFRPSFETVGKKVKSGTIFAELNGVPNGDIASYTKFIARLIVKDTLVYQSLPRFQASLVAPDFSRLVRTLVFNNSVDFGILTKSSHYSFGIYSEETQNLIHSKVRELLALDWCISDQKKMIYSIIEVIYSLPHDIIRMIHAYDFTDRLPKVIFFSGDTGCCGFEDSIVIMFLKLVGFDILAISPPGYTLLGQYIKKEQYNDMIVGPFVFDMLVLDTTNVAPKAKEKMTLFEKFLNRRKGV